MIEKYTNQFYLWRPDTPPVWHHYHKGDVYERTPVWIGRTDMLERDKNLVAFNTARNAIDKAMKQ